MFVSFFLSMGHFLPYPSISLLTHRSAVVIEGNGQPRGQYLAIYIDEEDNSGKGHCNDGETLDNGSLLMMMMVAMMMVTEAAEGQTLFIVHRHDAPSIDHCLSPRGLFPFLIHLQSFSVALLDQKRISAAAALNVLFPMTLEMSLSQLKQQQQQRQQQQQEFQSDHLMLRFLIADAVAAAVAKQ